MTLHNTYSQLMNRYYEESNPYHDIDEVCDYLDSQQYSPEELQALHNLVVHYNTSLDTDEYEQFIDDIEFGKFTMDSRDDEYFRMLDRQEMMGDMYAFEDENKTHDLFANNPWTSRSNNSDSTRVNKRSETTIDAQITHVGKNYSTATSEYGKVFIPRPCGLNLPIGKYEGKALTVRVRYQGSDGCRVSAMPWRTIAIVKQPECV